MLPWSIAVRKLTVLAPLVYFRAPAPVNGQRKSEPVDQAARLRTDTAGPRRLAGPQRRAPPALNNRRDLR